jgi:hypothetical protein
LNSPAPVVARRDERIRAQITAIHPLAGVRAGSALLRVADKLLAIQDDAFAAVWIDPATLETSRLVLRGGGEGMAKAVKPDFEAAFLHDERIWILGSGSRPSRCNLARLDLARREAPLFNVAPLFAAVERALGRDPNIEGAMPLGDRLRLFQRGPGRTPGGNFSVDLPIGVLAGGAPEVLGVTGYELGALDAVHLSFTDAIALGRHVIYLAVAEDTPDGIADGPIAGAAVGMLDAGGGRWNTLTEPDGSVSRRKVEGVALDAAGGGWLLTDPDDAGQPAELCRVELKF